MEEKTEYINILVERASAGNDDAFSELLIETQTMVYNLAYRTVNNEQDALDISQEVYMKVWRSIKNFRGESSIYTWLYRITQNCCLDFLRKSSRASVVSLTEEDEEDGERTELQLPSDESESPESIALQSERVDGVREAIAALELCHRDILILRDINGFTYARIAEIMELDVGTVKSRINRARGKLKEMLLSGNFI